MGGTGVVCSCVWGGGNGVELGEESVGGVCRGNLELGGAGEVGGGMLGGRRVPFSSEEARETGGAGGVWKPCVRGGGAGRRKGKAGG